MLGGVIYEGGQYNIRNMNFVLSYEGMYVVCMKQYR